MTACPSCGSPVQAEDRFCGNCGADLESAEPVAGPRFCTKCGGPLEEGDRFCGRCGAPVRAEPPEAEPPEAEPPAEPPAEPAAEADEDLFADWNLVFAEEPSPDPRNSVTEAVPRADGPADTEVIPLTPEREPEAPPERPPPRHPPPRGFPWGASVALVGGMAVVVSAILPWTGGGALPREIAARSLIQAGGESGLNLGVVLLVAGTIGSLVALLTMLVPWVGFLRRLVGILTLAVPVLFVLRALDPGAGLGGLVGTLEVGVYVAGAGALVQVIAGKWRT